MKTNKKTPNLFFILIIFTLGSALYEQFDAENLEFEKPALAIVYGITLGLSIYALIKDYKSKSEQ